MGNYTQYLVINHNGEEYEKRICICITESLCCTAEINSTNQLYLNKSKINKNKTIYNTGLYIYLRKKRKIIPNNSYK